MDDKSRSGHRPVRLLEQVRRAIRRKHYSYRTEMAYLHWIRRYIVFHDRRHPLEMGEAEMATCARRKLSNPM